MHASLPSFQGEKGTPRNWVFCHYQPYWGKSLGTQFVRDQNYKLYSNGNFFNVPNDLKEANILPIEGPGKPSHEKLTKVFETTPPAPEKKGGKSIKDRPTHPNWRNITNPND